MAQVPLYDAPQVQEAALPGARQESVASPELFGASARQLQVVGKQTADAGSEAVKIAVKLAHEADLEGVQRASAAYQKAAQDYTLEVKDKKTGPAAAGVVNDFDQWHKKTLSEMVQGLGNDNQKQAFATLAGRSALAVRHDLGAFQIQQSHHAAIQAANDYTTNTISLIAGATTNDAAAVHLDNLKNNIRAFAATQNLAAGSQGEKAMMMKAVTAAHFQRISNMVATDYTGAKAYFEANKDEMDRTRDDDVAKLLKSGSIRTIAQTTATELQAKGMSEADGLAYIRSKLSGDEQHAATVEWKERKQDEVRTRETAQRTAGDTAWGIYARTNRLSAIPPAVLNAMDGRDLVALRKTAEKVVGEKAVKTDFAVLYDLRKMSAENPEEFLKVNLNHYRDKLSPSDLEQFAILQTKPERRQDAATLGAQLSNMHDQMNWGGSDREKKGYFDKVVTDAIAAEQKRVGKPLDYEARQKIIDRMVIDGEVMNSAGRGVLGYFINDPNKRYYEVYGREDAAKFEPKVPDADRKDIEAALKRNNKPVTDKEVVRLYKLKHGM